MSAGEGRATIESMAALDFEPWPDLDWMPPSNEEWAKLANPYLVTIRLAWLIVRKTRPELVEIVGGLSDEDGRRMMEGFIDTLAFFEAVVGLLQGAEARILVAGSAIVEQGGA